MPKALTISGMVIAALVLVIFLLDLVLGFPFSSASRTMDVGFIIAALLLGFLGWSSYRELK